MKTFYMLCGVPGSGKSTWVEDYLYHITIGAVDKTRILSTDDIIQNIADRHQLTYNEVFGDITYAFAEKMMFHLAKYAFERADTVIWDQTNLTPKSRAKKLAMVPADWSKTAIVFDTPEPEEHARRLASRKGKDIPEGVLYNMKKSFVIPTKEEGFNLILL